MAKRNWVPWVLLLLVASVGAALGGALVQRTFFPPDPPEPIYLPGEAVIEKVKCG